MMNLVGPVCERIFGLALPLAAFVATPALMPDQTCSYYDGDCYVAAVYEESRNRTIWLAECDDGYQDGGMIGGDQVPAICTG